MSKLIQPTVQLGDSALDHLQFQQDRTNAASGASQRLIHPLNLDSKNEVSYKVSVPNFLNMPPLKLGYKYISDLIRIDLMTPGDLYADEYIKNSGLDNYFFDSENGLGDFSRYELVNQLNLPDKFFDEYNATENTSKMGLFPDIERAWIAVDNKLILWNYKIPQSSFNKSTQFLTIDQIKHSILTVKLVRPKPDVFVKEVNHLLLIATTMNIHIYIVKYDGSLNNLEVFNPELSVLTQGLAVNNFAVNDQTNEIYFSGETDSCNIWRLDYTNKATFIKNKCDKVCLTKSGLSSVLPINKLPTFDLFNLDGASPANNLPQIPETVIQIEVDSSRGVLYSLSNKSVIRVYKLDKNQTEFSTHSRLTPQEIYRAVSSSFVDSANLKAFSKFKIVNIARISSNESSNVQLVAITNYGCRILLRLGGASMFSFGTAASRFSSNVRLSVVAMKFTPTTDVPKLNGDLDSFTRNKQYTLQLIASQQNSQLLKNTKLGRILSPGVFITVKKSKGSHDKLFISTANYGFIKKNNRYIEDAEFVGLGSLNDTAPTVIHDIVQLTPSMNATDTPSGYANILATQYTKPRLQFAVLTNFGILIYQFKTSDQLLKSLKETTVETFIDENGYEETCSSLLYLGCSYSHRGPNDDLRRKALVLFSTTGNNARLLQTQPAMGLYSNQTPANPPENQTTMDLVVLSDRFYGTCLLVSRLFRDVWAKKVFTPLPHIKFVNGSVDLTSVKEDNYLIQNLNIDKKQVEFFIGSVLVLIDFFVENSSGIQGLNAPNYSSDPSKFESEVCLRAEHIAFTSILKSLGSMKEALSFLMVLIEESEVNATNFDDILKFLSLTNQLNLLTLSFKDLLLPNREVKNLIKDLLSSIINKNILKGGSIDLIASSLQGRCGSFCSADDVYIFKAIENLTRAKNIGERDQDLKVRCLKNAVALFEQAYESLTLENIENSINIMLSLEYYTGAVDLLIKLAHKLGLVTNVDANNQKLVENNKKTLELYDLIFRILTKVDLRAIKISESNDQVAINQFIEVRDATYDTCFASQDKAFHYEFYNWFFNQGVKDRLLDINTPFILPYLEEKSENDLEFNDLLWLYHAKRESYFAAANILYSLAISEFKLDLKQRIEYLSRANGFCNCVCPPNLRQKMIELSSLILDLFEVANLQLDVLIAIEGDKRINRENKELALASLNFKILSISELFNSYTDPLGYYELCLLIFKISDYKNTDDILKRWELLFERIFHEYLLDPKNSEPVYAVILSSFTSFGPRLSTNDLVFPIDELIKLVCKYIQEAIEEDAVTQTPSEGTIVEIFIKSGVSFEKLYFAMKSLIELNTYEVFPGFTNKLKKNEMVYLIKKWYATDKALRDAIPLTLVSTLSEYSPEVDPINKYIKNTKVLF